MPSYTIHILEKLREAEKIKIIKKDLYHKVVRHERPE